MLPFIKKTDFIVLTVFLLIIIGGYFVINSKDRGNTAVIKYNSNIVKEVPLNSDCTFSVNQTEFEVNCGKIRVTSSPCKDKICVKTGFIDKPSQTIVCLPEKIVVTITGYGDTDLFVG